MRVARCVLLVCAAGCAVRAPAPLDVAALVAQRGPIDARHDLELRVIADPRDVAGRLALAQLDDDQHRPTAAIELLDAVVKLGGPLGVRWHAADRARLARLIAARGRTRLARGAASAQADLARARDLGATITEDELRQARIAEALTWLHHSDAELRARGGAVLAALTAGTPTTSGAATAARPPPTGAASDELDVWRGARPDATPAQRGRFGAWLWDRGARRAAWDELSAWHAAARAPRDPALQDAYLVAARWWTPLDRPGPDAGELSGPMRCAFAGCAPQQIAGENLLERGYLSAPIAAPVRDPGDAAAIAVITLHQALRGEVSWGAALAARVDLTAFADPAQLATLPRYVQPLFARLTGQDAAIPSDGATPDERLVIAAERILAGAGAAELEPLIGDAPYADDLRRIVATRGPFLGSPRSEAAARHAGLTVPGVAAADVLRAIADGHARDPAIADRLAREAVAGAADAAAMHAVIAALFDALGDPARARAAWQAAVDASPEPVALRGLAEATARQGDGDAALIAATTAAAASGDPAIVWTSVARALAGAGRAVHALEAARSAIDLAGPDTIEAAYDVAITASQALDRDAQAAGLAAQRARIAQSRHDDLGAAERDPTDARAALEAYRQHPTSGTIARMWVAARWNPRAVELRAALLAATAADDPRRTVLVGELVELAADRDPELRRAAIAALR